MMKNDVPLFFLGLSCLVMNSCDSNDQYDQSPSLDQEIEELKNRVEILEQRVESLIDDQMRANAHKKAAGQGFDTKAIE